MTTWKTKNTSSYSNEDKNTSSWETRNKSGGGWMYDETDLLYNMTILSYEYYSNPTSYNYPTKH